MASSERRVRVSIIGQVVGASHIGGRYLGRYCSAHCRWRLAAGPAWTHVQGVLSGSTQSDAPFDGTFTWQHPFDACFDGVADPAQHAWPRIELEVRCRDSHDRSDLAGYGVVHVPPVPGVHTLACRLWRPRGSLVERLTAFFLGGQPHLKEWRLIFGIEEPMEADGHDHVGNSLARSMGDARLHTQPSGHVHLNIGICVQRL